MRARVTLVAVAVASSLVLAQEDENPRSFKIELDTHHLQDDVAKAVKLLDTAPEDGVAQADRLLRDPRVHEDFVETRTGVLASADHLLRAKLERLSDAARKAYDARWDDDALRLEEQGTERSLARLLALYPGSSRARRCALRLALLELEAGDVATASTRLAELDEGAASVALPATLALLGRRRACGEALARLEGDDETLGRRLAALAARDREASGESAPTAGELGSVVWTHETSDIYKVGDPNAPSPALCEPTCDASVVYVQDQSRCVALDLETGKLIWRTALVEGADYYTPPQSACRVILGPSVVACALPTSAIVTLDRRSGERLATVTAEQLRALAGGLDYGSLVSDALVAGDVLVVALLAQDTAQDVVVMGFEARSGTLLWRVGLGHCVFDVGRRPLPLLARGAGLVFVAPGWGVLAAFEPITGEMAWLRRYKSLRESAPPRSVHKLRRALPAVESPPMRAGFLDVVRSRLVLAAPDSTEVHVFEPRTGEATFSVPDDGAPVVGVHGGRLVEMTRAGAVVEVAKAGPVARASVRGVAVPYPGVVVGDVLLLPRAGGGLLRIPLGRARDLEDEPAPDDAPRAAPVEVSVGPVHVAAWGGAVVATSSEKTVRLGEPAPVVSADATDAASLCRALGDPNAVVRDRAARALEALGEAAFAELDLASRSSDPERAYRARSLREKLSRAQRRARFADALSRSHDRTAGRQLASLVSLNPASRLGAIDQLGTTPDAPLAPIFEEMMADPEPMVALHAARNAFALGNRAALPFITKELASPVVARRRIAMDELVHYGRVEDEDLFVKGFADEDQDVRSKAIDGALAHGDARIAPALTRLVTQGDDALRRATLQKLGVMRIDPALAAPVLRVLARDPDWAVRHRTALALARHDHPEARAALAEVLSDPKLEVRSAAYESLRDRIMTEDPPQLPEGIMEKLLEHVPLERVAVLAAKRMVDRGKVVRPFALAQVALTAPLPIQQDALAALRRGVDLAPLDSRDTAAIGSLTRTSLAPEVRQSAFETLVAAHGPGRGALLAKGLDDPDREVRALVASRLVYAGAEAIVEAEALAGDQSLRERVRAVLWQGRAELERLVRDEKDKDLAEKLRAALSRSQP